MRSPIASCASIAGRAKAWSRNPAIGMFRGRFSRWLAGGGEFNRTVGKGADRRRRGPRRPPRMSTPMMRDPFAFAAPDVGCVPLMCVRADTQEAGFLRCEAEVGARPAQR